MPESPERKIDSIKITGKEELDCMTEAMRVHSYLRTATIFMNPNQKAWLVSTISLFWEEEHLDILVQRLECFAILDERHIKDIIRCLLDDECRTALIKIMSIKGFM